MRKVTLHALQTDGFGFDRRIGNDIGAILEKHIQPRLNLSAELISRLAGPGPRIALTNEDVCGLYHFMTAERPFFDELAERAARYADGFFTALAKKHALYIAACYVKRRGGKNYNITSVFAPDGHIAGEYRKTHIPPDEMWQVADGEDLNIIELPFGRVGVLTCYDMMFPEAASVLAMRGAELILHPTAGYGWYDAIGEATLRARANDNSVYILTAKNYVLNAAGKSSVIDPWGHVLADAGFGRNVVVSREIDLDEPKEQPEWFYPSQMSGIPDIRKRYLRERRPELYGILSEPAERLRVPDDEEREVLRGKIERGDCRW